MVPENGKIQYKQSKRNILKSETTGFIPVFMVKITCFYVIIATILLSTVIYGERYVFFKA